MIAFALALCFLPQQPAASPPGSASPFGVRYDERGWPIVDEPSPTIVPSATANTGRPTPAAAVAAAPSAETATATLGQVGSARDFTALGGITVWWRISVLGPEGQTIGLREVTHLADAAAIDRDRLEHSDGRVCGRSGATVFAERHGLPWPTLVESSSHELQLFGLHVRMPWALGDRRHFAELGSQLEQRGSQRCRRLRLVRRVAAAALGPLPDENRDREVFELVLPEEGGQPLELVHCLAPGQLRRVLLEDWRPVGAVMMSHRRVYVDGQGRSTTVLEILRVEGGVNLPERAFRLQ